MIAELIIQWYHSHRRDLPWRNTQDPYRIWVSEVILQQTRVEQGRAYYERFLQKFPDVFALAAAREQDVLLLWQGLGYYSRARNMHRAARQVVDDFNGVFPDSYKKLLTLKGVGAYTAAAIASFAFKKSHPAIDGNVNRVVARLFNIQVPVNAPEGGKAIKQCTEAIFTPAMPDLFNQAMMEFGALHCTARNPACQTCPVKEHCLAYADNAVHLLPAKKKKRAPSKRYLNYLVISGSSSETLYLTKRENPRDIWYNLYEFPLIESKEPLTAQQLTGREAFRKLSGNGNVVIEKMQGPVKHQLSHQTLFVYFWEISFDNEKNLRDDALKTPYHQLDEYPFPRLISAFVEENFPEYIKKLK